MADRPNDGFLAQLDIFYQASYKVSKRNKVMRMYYLERALDEIMRECPILILSFHCLVHRRGRRRATGEDDVPKLPTWHS